MVNPVEWVRLDVVLQLAAGVSRTADHRELRGGESQISRERLFLGALVEGDPQVPAWPVSAVVAPFDSPVIWVACVPAAVGPGVRCPRLVRVGSEPCCGVWLLLKVLVHLAWPAGRPAD